MADLSNRLSINSYIHCGKCLDELPAGKSPRDFAQHEIGFTRAGIQVWCKRHNCNVMHIDFEGHKHPADISAPEKVEE
jgi:hypothetical protein